MNFADSISVIRLVRRLTGVAQSLEKDFFDVLCVEKPYMKRMTIPYIRAGCTAIPAVFRGQKENKKWIWK